MPGTVLPLVKGLLFPLLCSISGTNAGANRGVSERVDLIELNHFYDERGRHAYDQVIFYEWSPDYCRFHVIAWCLVENNTHRMPTRVPGASGDWAVRWLDRDTMVHREVRSRLFRETWSHVDPERANKKLLEEKYRISLLRLDERQHR
ncbi:MAG: hypothetical protein KatS3mg111_4230 [Pirellulaceae bacterium]|nr:MAG: hypothetical protein KatS3mg111_4230 [Pirellulaceae bacterium]